MNFFRTLMNFFRMLMNFFRTLVNLFYAILYSFCWVEKETIDQNERHWNCVAWKGRKENFFPIKRCKFFNREEEKDMQQHKNWCVSKKPKEAKRPTSRFGWFFITSLRFKETKKPRTNESREDASSCVHTKRIEEDINHIAVGKTDKQHQPNRCLARQKHKKDGIQKDGDVIKLCSAQVDLSQHQHLKRQQEYGAKYIAKN